MAAKTAQRKPRTSPKSTRQKNGRMVSTDDWVQVYTRLKPDEAERVRKAAEADERSVMLYLRRLIISHLPK